MTGIVLTTFLCLVAAAAVVVTVWNLGWLWRIAVPLIVAVLAAGVAWRVVVRGRQGLSVRPFIFAAVAAIAMLTALHVVTAGESPVLAWLTGFGLAALTVGTVSVATWVVEHTESKAVGKARRSWESAQKARTRAVARAAGDEEAAELAEEAWLSLVEEEARLAIAEDGATPESWVTEVVEHARTLGRPGA